MTSGVPPLATCDGQGWQSGSSWTLWDTKPTPCSYGTTLLIRRILATRSHAHRIIYRHRIDTPKRQGTKAPSAHAVAEEANNRRKGKEITPS
jgi:hypothetical protein